MLNCTHEIRKQGYSYMSKIKSFEKSDLKRDQKVLIYGAGRYGELAYWGLKQLGIDVNFFIDEYRAGDEMLGIPVISPIEMTEYTNDIILLASYNYFAEMYYLAKESGAKYIYDILNLLVMEYDESVLSEYLQDEKHNYMKYKNVVENMLQNKLVINHCEIVLTECCSLKCNLMQYYKKPEHLDIDEIISSFNNFLDSVDMLLDLRLLGGEPFIYPHLDRIVNEYKNNDKIRRIAIYTNSTIVPSENVLDALRNVKTVVHMSDYGNASRKIGLLEEKFNEAGIEYYIHRYEKWKNIGNVCKRDYNAATLKNIYQTCVMGKCYTLYRGKFYLCPRAAHGERLGFFSNPADEFVDFNGTINVSEKRKELQELVARNTYITACNYCNGSSLKSESIPAAIQV